MPLPVSHPALIPVDVSQPISERRPDLALTDAVGSRVSRLIEDEALRERHAARCRELFDGRGAERVVDAIERLAG